MKSNWDTARARSDYHFNPGIKDNPMDVMQYLGHITPTWDSDLEDIVKNAKPATWATRGYKGEASTPSPL